MQAAEPVIRPLREDEVDQAHRVFRIAFGTFLGLPEPLSFGEESRYIERRWQCNPNAVLAAEVDRELAGTNVLTRWGSFAFFGPLTVNPEYWDRKIGSALLGPTIELFDKWGTTHQGLYTFANSPKHIGLYQKFGFWPRFLTAVMTKAPNAVEAPQYATFSSLSSEARDEALGASSELTGSLLEGLDLRSEIRAVFEHNMGETILLEDSDKLGGFAICCFGPESERGPNVFYVKFATVRGGGGAGERFMRLLQAIDNLAARAGIQTIEAGMNLAHEDAYRRMRQHGFQTRFQGVAMHRPNAAGYKRPDVYAIDDWR